MSGSMLALHGVGIDIVHIPRILKLISRKNYSHSRSHLSRFVERILTPSEHIAFRKRWGSDEEIFRDEKKTSNCAAHLAGRWAAKEAVIKAVSPDTVWMNQIQISGNSGGGLSVSIPPGDSVRGTTSFLTSTTMSDFAKISISHDGDYAIAMCLSRRTD
ncbi:4'-phosphopantetheinyl transferase [Viridothelium virens]|uniref:4'-phosphopantetheinyl transferase n=1 Tax=Viridothelium virens TaxID=1048519 RepID=A0A6A6HCU6_VIRVR|nr:4'-phosphopantetheinyl transferase [Viridothelium virens]